MVDAAAVSAELAAADGLAERSMAAGPGDARTIADLIMDQIEFADTLILNKCDLVHKVCPQGTSTRQASQSVHVLIKVCLAEHICPLFCGSYMRA